MDELEKMRSKAMSSYSTLIDSLGVLSLVNTPHMYALLRVVAFRYLVPAYGFEP